MRILCKVMYDGTNYKGWQKQPDEKTVQGEIEKVLKKIYKENVHTVGASRTDTGVHALSQYVAFDIDDSKVIVPAERLFMVLNQKLPDDIKCIESRQVANDFHPRFHKCIKTYTYKICNVDIMNPTYRNYMWQYKGELDVDKMREGAEYLLGKHDFASFSNLGGNVKTSVRTVYSVNITKNNNVIELTISGDGFLYNMVRIVVGTLVAVGRGKYPPEHIREIIKAKNRRSAGNTAGASGLTLYDIQYI